MLNYRLVASAARVSRHYNGRVSVCSVLVHYIRSITHNIFMYKVKRKEASYLDLTRRARTQRYRDIPLNVETGDAHIIIPNCCALRLRCSVCGKYTRIDA